MNEDSLECNSDYFYDTIENMNTAGDGSINIEDSNCDGERTVDEDEEDTKVEQEQINRVIGPLTLVFV